MRSARIREEGGACYHVMSRVIEGRMILDEAEKHRFVDLMRRMSGFSGVQILTFAILDNHFHALLHVPAWTEVSDSEFISRMGFLYEKRVVKTHAEALEQLREDGDDAGAQAYKAKFTYRMYDLSEYMKTLKQRFTQSYNRRHGRKGTLWEERFKSLLVQAPSAARGSTTGRITAVAAVGLYIDLNAVRAGIVDDPKDFRFCAYAQAVAGHRDARRGIRQIVEGIDGNGTWEQTGAIYRRLLYIRGERDTTPGTATRHGFSPQRVRDVIAAGGELSTAEVLRCRVRYFNDGVVLGTRRYVDDVFRRHRGFFSPKRKSGARPMAGADWGGLCTARRLRLDVITPSMVD